ncbi:lytic transglycosylase domain-containing protein [Pseudoflavitalea sp. G-6-1-2]|uniref:lytic transglycosylase domain-containing protein n=1 Tax=Pseudoflavitalea sp. G-6-1-2 TaxID=2728841 RepID=UPI00146DF6A4|nr:lytic transglycosylase domain-containing protein [Pseudoflavitalea sp. G-6-1-2]NML21198.1 lytic transglycosylase domain-containing protein [Pseudoflavitalea sp. G-6-1-2]
MKNLPNHLAPFLSGALIALLICCQLAFRDNKQNNAEAGIQNSFSIIPDSIDFAGEPVPLHRWDVKERLDRELLINLQSRYNVLMVTKLAGRYFPVIEERLKANGVPNDFKYVCAAESTLVPNAVSKAGAVGFWQFMPGTAPMYDLKINQEVDYRNDLIRSTDAACQYFKQAYARFGSWTAAAASYNCGMAGYGAQAGFQQSMNYYDLLLPEETNRYIFRILTFKHLLKNAKSLGLELPAKELYQPVPYREVMVSSSIADLAAFAISQGTTYKELRLLNPWLKGRSLTVSGGASYVLKLPAAK